MAFRSIHKFGLTSCSAAALLALSAPAAAYAQAATYSFNIPSQDLAGAVRAYARATRQQVAIDSDAAKGLRSNALVGSYGADEGLRTLLAPGFTYTRSDRGVILVKGPQGAAGATPAAEASQVGEVVVTGTNIRGGVVTGLVTTITRSDFERQGFLDVGQAIRSLPGNFSGGINPENLITNVQQDNAARSTTHVASANLLGLGSGSTLTLLNGKRLPVTAEGLAVDIGLIPTAAINRVDVLTDGSSAIYGTDAVAGVVNIVTMRSYDGVETRLRYGRAKGGLDTYVGSVLAGASYGAASGVLGIQYSQNTNLRSDTRERASAMQTPFDLVGASSRTSYFGSGQVDITPRFKLYADALYMQRIGRFKSTYSGITQYDQQKISEYSLSAGVVTQIGKSWQIDLFGTANRNRTKYPGAYNYAGVDTLLIQDRTNYLRSIEARASGEVVTLPTGPVRMATGMAYRTEGLSSIELPRLNNSRDIKSAYGELDIPLLGAANEPTSSLHLVLAGRVDDYSDVGTVSVPKFGLLWTVSPSLSISANYSKSFRAPSPYDRGSNYYSQVRNAQTAGGLRRVLYLGGTGSSLSPERSTNRTIAVTYRPEWLANSKFSLSYFDIKYTDRITSPDPTGVFQSDIRTAPADLINTAPTQAEIAALARGSSYSYAYGGVPYDLTLVTAIVDMRSTNVASTHISGVQASANYGTSFAGGTLDLSANASYIDTFDDRVRSDLPAVQRVGRIFSPPHWRTRAGATWTRGVWTSAVFWDYVDDYIDSRVVGAPVGVSAWNTVDASLSYDFEGTSWAFGRDLRVVLSATNIFDAKPPFITNAGSRYSAANWDSTNASIIGRFASIELVKKW